jgi:DNA-binding LacI/PurR family transcriptional regulator
MRMDSFGTISHVCLKIRLDRFRMNNSPKHRAITSQLATEILAGKYAATGRLPSEVQLVKRFKVARPTIGQALRGLQERGLIERRAGSGTYVSSGGNTAVPRSTLPQIGMIVPCLRHTEIFESILGELAALIRGADFDFWSGITASPMNEPQMTSAEAEALCERFIERSVRGVFFVPFEHQPDRENTNRRIAERLRQAGIPVVLIDRDLGSFPKRSAYDLVGIDNFVGGYVLAEHLIKLGHRRLGYVVRPLTAATVDARIAGARAALLDHGIEAARSFVQSGDPTDLKFVRSFTRSKQLDAVFCASDHIAAQLLQSLNRLGIRVPQDLRLVGFDNVPFSSLLTIPLTTMEQSCRDLAITAFNALRERIANPSLPPRTLIVTPRIVIRESCGAFL